MNEAQTRLEKIDPKLKAAGWNTIDDSRILTEYVIAQGKISVSEKRKILKADYILTYKGVKLAIVEAKSDDLPVGEGVMQAKLYAQMMRIRFTYATNGDEIYQIDMFTGEESLVDAFPSPETVWNNTFTETNQWRDKFYAEPFYLDEGKRLRYYQEIAINRVLEAIAKGETRILLTLATGTGKTLLAFQIAWKLYQTKWNISNADRHPRILFLADRNFLANQAFNKFGGFSKMDENSMVRITPKSIKKKGGKLPKNASVFFTIFQTFDTGEVEPHFGQYSPDFFDFIIIDECHRGGANDESRWRRIMEYFSPAVQLGLTATPRRDVNADTYNYFGKPVFEYSLKEGINDGFLTPFRHVVLQSNIDDYVYQPTDTIVDGDIDEIDKLVKGKTYTETDFYQGRIEIKQRDEERVKEFMKLIGKAEKTIVFCYTQAHAAAIRDMINQQKKEKNALYCVRVTANDGEQGENYLRDFQDNDRMIPTVLTTSQKLSTGLDALNVRNIVLLRPINSMIEFKQIIGRGTRCFDGKYYFTIFDFVGAYKKFSDPTWDGLPVCRKCGNDPCTCNKKTLFYPCPEDEQSSNACHSSEFETCPICGKNPCECKPTTDPCPQCGNSPCTCEKKKRVVITLSDGRARHIQHIKTDYFWDADGKPISAQEFLEKMFGQLPQFFSDEKELRNIWSDPYTRKVLLGKMADAGYDEEVMKKVQTIINADNSDLYDVLEYIAYAKEPVKRLQRASLAQQHSYIGINDKQQEFIHFVLAKYVESGVKELAIDNLPELLKFKYGTAMDGIRELGDIQITQNTFIGFQKYLYAPVW
ncbi:MAG: DEAD/DEAH box helicase family protein [Bacteroidota bacterium]|nr:DEAD/DEAH box helicase family protein [Bacteroidota bacterium]